MKQKRQNESCIPAGGAQSCCRIESLLSIDERGQMVLPKELRERAGIHAGDKLALISLERDGTVCCLCLIKAEHLSGQVRDFLGPIMEGVAAK